jgi:hypothetical protein
MLEAVNLHLQEKGVRITPIVCHLRPGQLIYRPQETATPGCVLKPGNLEVCCIPDDLFVSASLRVFSKTSCALLESQRAWFLSTWIFRVRLLVMLALGGSGDCSDSFVIRFVGESVLPATFGHVVAGSV